MRGYTFCRFLLLAFLLAATLGALGGCAPKRIAVRPDANNQAITGHDLGSKIARTATTQLGKAYRAGGDSPQRGFDCSGLIYWAFAQNGITVPRMTPGQANTGQSVTRGRLAPGDIVVFRAKSGPNGLHTGIYTGQNNFVHSPNRKGRVRIESLSTPYWDQNFLTARRVVGAQAGR